MTPQRWKRIEEIAEAALKRDALLRVDFLDAACEGELELRQQVEGFLAAFEEVETFLERPANLDHEQQDSTIELAAASSAMIDSESLPLIGSYRLLREIGQGGMGTVYLAARDDEEFQHRVAIKLLRPGAGSESLMRRFRSERQILANLDHPNIAKLLDGGTTREDHPYLVMELITGQRIDEYCARYQLTIHQRLDLFLDVCAAVAYAHRNLVVHRDIKPTNILVTDDGTPKLLDFGIAKLLDPTDFPLTIEATETGLRPMTPPYASPEQIQGQPITTASDVYSLGVLLYKLLTGRLPFSTRDLPRHELERVLVESLPERPSRAITRPGSNDRAANLPATRRRGRAGRVQQLQRQLKGDLDNIVLMALRKEPERRYSSVDQLMEDLHRHLVGRPVAARRDTFFYRSGKLLKRNKVAAGIAGSSLVLLTGFAVAMARQAIQVTRQRDLARQEREKAERTAGFLADTFALADPYNAEGAPATLLEILQAGEVRLEDELANQPEIRTRLMVTIGSIYRRRGHYKKATRLLKRALSVQESLLGQHHIDTSTALNELALSHQEGGSLKNARILLQRALAIRRKLLPADDNGNAEVLVNLAATDLINGDLASAESLVKESLKILNKDSVTNPTLLARAFDLSSMVHLRRGEYEQAEATRRLGLSLMKSTADTDPRQMAIAVVHQGNYYCVRNDLKRAEVAFRRALAMFQRAVGQSHPDVAVTLTNIGACHSMAGEYQRAKRLYLRAIKILEKTVGPHHRDVAILLCRLGILYRRKGKFDQASSYLDRALENFEQVEQNYQNIAYALFQRARVFVECMDLSSGEMLYRQAAEIQRHRLGPKNQQLLETLTALSELLVQQGRNEEANTLYRQVIDTTRQATEGDPENCRTRTIRAAALMGLGDLFMATGQEQKAAQQWSQALDIMETQVASAWVVESRDIHCRTLLRLGQIAEAKPIVEELLSIGWCCSDFLDRCRQHGLLPTPPANESPLS